MCDKDNKIKEDVARLKIKIVGRYMPRRILFQGRTQGGGTVNRCVFIYVLIFILSFSEYICDKSFAGKSQ